MALSIGLISPPALLLFLDDICGPSTMIMVVPLIAGLPWDWLLIRVSGVEFSVEMPDGRLCLTSAIRWIVLVSLTLNLGVLVLLWHLRDLLAEFRRERQKQQAPD
ncbi:MAG: hypothetical protein KBC73_13505 [Burkholderiaceae bacterium]|nr:hypothetical protein [Burkholderiaceae bacterium]